MGNAHSPVLSIAILGVTTLEAAAWLVAPSRPRELLARTIQESASGRAPSPAGLAQDWDRLHGNLPVAEGDTRAFVAHAVLAASMLGGDDAASSTAALCRNLSSCAPFSILAEVFQELDHVDLKQLELSFHAPCHDLFHVSDLHLMFTLLFKHTAPDNEV